MVPASDRMEGSTPTVLFGEGHGPESSTHVRFEEFEGPLALLLSLIEARRLDILTVPLAGLTVAYLEALAMLPGDRLGNISSFVTVASQLILIKSRALLPPRGDSTVTGGEALDDAPDPEAELRARLLLYRAYRDAGSALQERVTGASGLFRREPAAAQAAAIAGARAPQRAPLDVGLLVDGLGLLIRIVPPPEPPPEVLARSVTVEERAAIIRMALRGAGVVVLQDILRGVSDRVLVAVTFLALLELMKRREIVVEQAEPWGPIVARTAELEPAG
ncbi:MAG: hypothetical protein E6H96_05175 [Chloroflexi bacterium]|nr:MAG: hypothetical protein E6H96_05175 [Chloroflexota bacterium]